MLTAPIAQETGDSETSVMSQKAVSDYGAEIESEVEQINSLYTDIPFTLDSRYLDTNGAVQSNVSYKCTEFIPVEAGDIFMVNCAYNERICAYDSEQAFLKIFKDFTSAQTGAEVEINDANIKYIRASGTYTNAGVVGTLELLRRNTASIPYLTQRVDAVASEMHDILVDNLTEYTQGFIGSTGNVSTNSSYGYKLFDLPVGAVVTLTCGTHPNVCPIAMVNDTSPVTYTPIIIITGGFTVETLTYTAESDCTIAVSFGAASTHRIVIDSSRIDAASIRAINNKEALDGFKESYECNEVVYGYMADKIAVIGDSLASGAVEGIKGEADAVGSSYYGISWLALLARRWGCSGRRNYSVSGYSTISWLANMADTLTDDETTYDIYFIALGTNNESTVGTIDDDADTESFFGRYQRIINLVRAKAPHAMIVCLSLYEPRDTESERISQIVEKVREAGDDGIFYLDYMAHAKWHRYSPETNWRGHFSSVGYLYAASAINAGFNAIVDAHKTETFFVQWAKYHSSKDMVM